VFTNVQFENSSIINTASYEYCDRTQISEMSHTYFAPKSPRQYSVIKVIYLVANYVNKPGYLPNKIVRFLQVCKQPSLPYSSTGRPASKV
jgi:hypothetical protein